MSNLPALNSVAKCPKCLLTHSMPQCLASYTYMPAINSDSKPSDIAFRERNNIPLTECMQRRCSRCAYEWFELCADTKLPNSTNPNIDNSKQGSSGNDGEGASAFDYASKGDKIITEKELTSEEWLEQSIKVEDTDLEAINRAVQCQSFIPDYNGTGFETKCQLENGHTGCHKGDYRDKDGLRSVEWD